MAAGVLDDERSTQVEERVFLRFARCFQRVLDAGDLTARLVGGAMAPGGVWPLPEGCVPHGAPTDAVERLAESVIAAPEVSLTFVPYLDPFPEVKATRVGIWPSIQLFWRHFARHLRGLPGQAATELQDGLERRVEHFVQQRTFGRDTSVWCGCRAGPLG